jgi:hypothetical protein
MKKVYLVYKKNCEEEGFNTSSYKTFGLTFESVVDKLSITKNRSRYM